MNENKLVDLLTHLWYLIMKLLAFSQAELNSKETFV